MGGVGLGVAKYLDVEILFSLGVLEAMRRL